MSDATFQVVEREMAPIRAVFADELTQNAALFARIEAVYKASTAADSKLIEDCCPPLAFESDEAELSPLRAEFARCPRSFEASSVRCCRSGTAMSSSPRWQPWRFCSPASTSSAASR